MPTSPVTVEPGARMMARASEIRVGDKVPFAHSRDCATVVEVGPRRSRGRVLRIVFDSGAVLECSPLASLDVFRPSPE